MITLEKLKTIVAALKANVIPPLKVETTEQAERMTRSDPVGHVWAVGEGFYEVSLRCQHKSTRNVAEEMISQRCNRCGAGKNHMGDWCAP